MSDVMRAGCPCGYCRAQRRALAGVAECGFCGAPRDTGTTGHAPGCVYAAIATPTDREDRCQ